MIDVIPFCCPNARYTLSLSEKSYARSIAAIICANTIHTASTKPGMIFIPLISNVQSKNVAMQKEIVTINSRVFSKYGRKKRATMAIANIN
jgi:hypothetical protein